jgi:hypothetical protein
MAFSFYAKNIHDYYIDIKCIGRYTYAGGPEDAG